MHRNLEGFWKRKKKTLGIETLNKPEIQLQYAVGKFVGKSEKQLNSFNQTYPEYTGHFLIASQVLILKQKTK